MKKRESVNRLATFGGRMRAVRLARGLSAENVAISLEVSRPTITTWEGNKVETPPKGKLEIFAKMTEISLEWLMAGTGEPPDLPLDIPSNTFVGRRHRVMDNDRMQPGNLNRTLMASRHGYAAVPEISPLLTHADNNMGVAAAIEWMIPTEVLAFSLNCDPCSTVIRRVLIAPGPGQITFKKGDYVLIDTSRTEINEPGIYIASDEANGIKWVQATEVDEQPVLGRLMGVLHPA